MAAAYLALRKFVPRDTAAAVPGVPFLSDSPFVDVPADVPAEPASVYAAIGETIPIGTASVTFTSPDSIGTRWRVFTRYTGGATYMYVGDARALGGRSFKVISIDTSGVTLQVSL